VGLSRQRRGYYELVRTAKWRWGLDRIRGKDRLHTDAVDTYNEEIQYTVRLGDGRTRKA